MAATDSSASMMRIFLLMTVGIGWPDLPISGGGTRNVRRGGGMAMGTVLAVTAAGAAVSAGADGAIWMAGAGIGSGFGVGGAAGAAGAADCLARGCAWRIRGKRAVLRAVRISSGLTVPRGKTRLAPASSAAISRSGSPSFSLRRTPMNKLLSSSCVRI